MRNLIIYIFGLAMALTIITGCKKNTVVKVDYKHGYYPLYIGHTLIYEVDTTLYDPIFTNGRKTFSWQLKEEIVDEITDNLGRKAFRYERTRRKSDLEPWRLPIVGRKLIDNQNAENFENNLRFIPLVFPPVIDKSWDGNAHISNGDTLAFYQDWNYKYESVDQPFTLNGIQSDSALLINEVYNEDLFNLTSSQSVYAKNIGLMEKTQFNLKSDGSKDPDSSWNYKATHGFSVNWKLISHK